MDLIPKKVEFYIYAKNDQEVQTIQDSLYTFVEDCRKEGIVVTAEKLNQAIEKFKNNFFVKRFLR